MKKITYLLLPFFIVACGDTEADENNEETTTQEVTVLEEEEVEEEGRKSPRTSYTSEVDGVNLIVDYGSPKVKGREIWGKLVPYDEVWRAGADEVTALTFKNDVVFEGKTVMAGTYGFFLIPHENEEWDIILNEEWSKEEHDVWGAYDYKQEKDVLRVKASAISMSESNEDLKYSFENGKLVFQWETITLNINISPANPA